MRTIWKVTALSLAIVLAACGKRQQETAALADDLQKDLAAVNSGGGLATAPQSYQRMRFVSSIERVPAGVSAKRPTPLPQRAHTAATHHHATQPVADVAAEPVAAATEQSPATVSTPEAATPEPSIAVAPVPAPEPSSAPAGSGSGGNVGDHGQGGGLGGLLGGIMGAVIRGGHVGVDKCDPRTDGRARPPIIDRPDFGLPLPTGQPTFPRR